MQISKWMAAALAVLVAVSCDQKNNGSEKPDTPDTPAPSETGYVREIEQAADDFNYREPSMSGEVLYTPSEIVTKYKPIDIKYYGGSAPVPNWTTGKARILHYMIGYETPFKTFEKYSKWTNKWGSDKTVPRRDATGRFRVEKVDGRWWIIDPLGYRHYQRALTSVRYGSSQRNKDAWNAKYGSDEKWMDDIAAEFAQYGFNGTGAFCTSTYTKIIDHNARVPLRPLTLCPSFGTLSAYKSASGHPYPGGNSDYKIGLVLYDDWPEWCKTYLAGKEFEPYRNNQNVLGFYSDNEINFSANASTGKLLKIFLGFTDDSDICKRAAMEFLRSKGLPETAASYTDALNDEFCGMLAEKYYKAIKEARDAADPKLMYLGSRLHGTPKYMEHVVRAAGKYCDIVSINYYSRWSPELDTRIKDWEKWADKPFLVTEFYVKGIEDSDLNNESGAGWCVPRQEDRAYWYQHFTLGLLEARNCVGWQWFKYQDDDGTDNSSKPANKGMYDNAYNIYPTLARFAREINFNVYDLIDYFDAKR